MRVGDDGVPFEDLITSVKAAVKKANISEADSGRDLRVTELTLTLEVVAQHNAGAGVELKVPVIGMKLGGKVRHGRKSTHTIEVTLAPPERELVEVRGGDVERTLVEAITTVRHALIVAAGGDDPFTLKTSSVTLKFAVTDTGSISLVGEGDLTDEVTHTLSLQLSPAS